MKEITLTNYESLEEFIEVVDSVHFWDSIDADDYPILIFTIACSVGIAEALK